MPMRIGPFGGLVSRSDLRFAPSLAEVRPSRYGLVAPSISSLPQLLLLSIVLAALLGPALGRGAPDEAGKQDWTAMREKMVEQQIKARGVSDPRVLEALARVERHRFVPEKLRVHAYDDGPLPIGRGQTISQPYIVAAMTDALDLEPGDSVLEVGTGSGYQAAVLSLLVERVYSIEIVEELGESAKELLSKRGYDNVEVIIGDGYAGLPEHAPFDAIIVTAAPSRVPPPLIEQLKPGARLVIPVGSYAQDLRVLQKTDEGVITTNLFPVRFVPMTGRAEQR